MNRYYFIVVASLFLLGSCASVKNGMIVNGDINAAIHNAINDFLHSVKKDKSNLVFYVSAKSINQDLYEISIDGTNDKVVVITEDSVNFKYDALPTGYVERDEKLFYWHDSTQRVTVSEEMILTLKKHNILDTLVVGVYIPESTITHGKKGSNYYFCKSNLQNYKRVRTSRAIGYYPTPKLKCN